MARALYRLAIAALGLALVVMPAAAQCPLCRTAAASQDDAATKALNLAILVLFLPAVSMFCGVYYISFRYRNARDDESPEGDAEDE